MNEQERATSIVGGDSFGAVLAWFREHGYHLAFKPQRETFELSATKTSDAHPLSSYVVVEHDDPLVALCRCILAVAALEGIAV